MKFYRKRIKLIVNGHLVNAHVAKYMDDHEQTNCTEIQITQDDIGQVLKYGPTLGIKYYKKRKRHKNFGS